MRRALRSLKPALKQPEREKAWLRRTVADLTLDKVILAEAARRNY